MSKSNLSPKSRKAGHDRPAKPYPGFPLFPHASGRWAKKIRQRLEYFGKWRGIEGDGWKTALEEYQKHADNLHAGRARRVDSGALTVKDLCNHFLAAKEKLADNGEITRRTFDEYRATSKRLIGEFGSGRLVDDLRADDFDNLRANIAKRWGVVRLANEIQKVRTICKFGYDASLIDRPVRFGPSFKKPSASVMRKHRAASGERMIEAGELRRLIEAAPAPLKAMILLGVNAGLGNHDVAMLPIAAVDLAGGWLNFPRPKTGVGRRCPLWPETIEALREAEAARPAPKDEDAAKLFFLTVRGRQWLCRGIANPVSVAARKLMKSVGIDRRGVGLYTLRHVFRTVADGSGDQVAANSIMGHVDASMSATYRERIDDSRLLAVVNFVHAWLWPATVKAAPEVKAKPRATAKPKRKAAPRSRRRPAAEAIADDGPVLLRLFG